MSGLSVDVESLSVGAECSPCASLRSLLGELGIGATDEVAAVIVARDVSDGLDIQSEPAAIDRVDHPLDRAGP
jgi:hypothetical protein